MPNPRFYKRLLDLCPQIRILASMKIIAFAIALTCFGAISPSLMAKDKVKNLARVKRNADGTITELKVVDKNTVVRVTLREKKNKERIISSKSTYSIDNLNRARVCHIADGKGNLIFKIKYGYSKRTGRLLSEGMFDMRVKRLNAEGKEVPVQRLYYKYDAHGNRSKPFAITNQGGEKVEKVKGWEKHIQERLDKHDTNT